VRNVGLTTPNELLEEMPVREQGEREIRSRGEREGERERTRPDGDNLCPSVM
jgi:hypothetical protein